MTTKRKVTVAPNLSEDDKRRIAEMDAYVAKTPGIQAAPSHVDPEIWRKRLLSEFGIFEDEDGNQTVVGPLAGASDG